MVVQSKKGKQVKSSVSSSNSGPYKYKKSPTKGLVKPSSRANKVFTDYLQPGAVIAFATKSDGTSKAFDHVLFSKRHLQRAGVAKCAWETGGGGHFRCWRRGGASMLWAGKEDIMASRDY